MPIVRRCLHHNVTMPRQPQYCQLWITEVIWSDNGCQFASHLSGGFVKDWNIMHNTSSPRNSRSNGQAESAVKVVKGLLTHAKCSGHDPYLTLLAYRSTQLIFIYNHLPRCFMHNHASKDQAQGSPCSS